MLSVVVQSGGCFLAALFRAKHHYERSDWRRKKSKTCTWQDPRRIPKNNRMPVIKDSASSKGKESSSRSARSSEDEYYEPDEEELEEERESTYISFFSRVGVE